MKSMSRLGLIVTVFLVQLYFAAQTTQAQATGAVPVRIGEGVQTRCINSAKDQVWINLRRVITKKSGGWLKEDKSVAAIVAARIQLAEGKAITFPLISETTIQPYSKGQVSVPIEYIVVNGLPLTQDKVTYSGIQIDLTLLNKAGKTKWGHALESLSALAKKLPVPNTPFTQIGNYVLDTLNSAVDKEIADQNKDDKKSASLALSFSPDGKCSGDFEETGTIAVLQSEGEAGRGLIDISKVNLYCWQADFKPSFALRAALKDSQLACNSPQYKPSYQPVSNNYVAFFINARERSKILAEDDADLINSLKRCSAHGLSKEQCFPKVQ